MNNDSVEYVEIYDLRTGKVCCSGVWSKKLAERKILEFKERQLKGQRPDISKQDVDSMAIRPVK